MHKHFLPPLSLGYAMLIALAGCASSSPVVEAQAPPESTTKPAETVTMTPIYSEGDPPPQRRTIAPQTNPQTLNFASTGNAEFDAWRDDFASRARNKGRQLWSITQILGELKAPQKADLEQNASPTTQSEFAETIWEYLNKRVSEKRIMAGRAKAAQHQALLSQLETRFGVPSNIIAAIWGMETNYGGFMGKRDVAQALADMAFQGRRRQLGEENLLALMRILEFGYATRDQFIGSWAGAMGQTQFMPATYVRHAIDYDDDGRKDLWNNEGDALGSAASFLRASGWVADEPVFVEARLNEGFDFSSSDGGKRSLATWQRLGVIFDPGTTDLGRYAKLYTPAGAEGPILLTFGNFDVIKRYNNSNAYALSIALLARQISYQPGLQKAWPTHLPRMSVADLKALQAGLNALGFPCGTPDGVVGRNTRKALRHYQTSRGFTADAFPTHKVLAAIRSEL